MLFERSVWAREYNGSEVISLQPKSLTVRVRLRLKSPDVGAAQNLGSAFLRGLREEHEYSWLGPFSVDISSIRFSEVLVDSPISTTASAAVASGAPSTHQTAHHYQDRKPERHYPPSTPKPSIAHLSVGWGQWGPWSACNPCAPQFTQIRTRECRLEGGSGLLINTIEPCMKLSKEDSSGSTVGDMETRSCQCEKLEDNIDTNEMHGLTTVLTTTTTSTIPPMMPPYRELDNNEQDTYLNEHSENREYLLVVLFICLIRIS